VSGATAESYDRYWDERDAERTRARSASRARLGLRLLGVSGCGERSASPLRLLEVGCGPGWALEVFAQAGLDARGIDVSPAAVERACARGLRAEAVDIEQESIAARVEERFDVVASLEVLEHLLDPLAALAKIGDVLAPDGRLLISLPNEIHALRRAEILAGRLSFGGHDDPHIRHFDLKAAERLFAAAGLRVVDRLDDSIVPPRRKWLRRIAAPAVRLLPRLFSLAHVFLLERRSDG